MGLKITKNKVSIASYLLSWGVMLLCTLAACRAFSMAEPSYYTVDGQDDEQWIVANHYGTGILIFFVFTFILFLVLLVITSKVKLNVIFYVFTVILGILALMLCVFMGYVSSLA